MGDDTMIKPDVSCEMAIELVQRLYGFEVLSIKELVSYDDRNFHIQVSPVHKNSYVKSVCSDGYTLKITNTEKTAIKGHFESIHSAFEFLNHKGLRVPLPVSNINGEKWIPEKLPLVQKYGSSSNTTPYGLCGIHMLIYIPGDIISAIPYTEDVLKQWGQELAKFHISLLDYDNEFFNKKDIYWSLSHLLEITNLMDELDSSKTELIMDVLSNYRSLQSEIDSMPKGYIHGDLNEANILVRESSSGYIVGGVLDLEDMHFGLYVWDVGIMLAYVSLGCTSVDPVDGMSYALEGYLQLRQLSGKEISLLKICIACRLCQSLVLGAYNYKLNPSNDYLLKSSKSGWQRLNLIWSTPNELLIKKWNAIRERKDCSS